MGRHLDRLWARLFPHFRPGGVRSLRIRHYRALGVREYFTVTRVFVFSLLSHRDNRFYLSLFLLYFYDNTPPLQVLFCLQGRCVLVVVDEVEVEVDVMAVVTVTVMVVVVREWAGGV